MSTELSEPVSAHPSPAGRPTSLGGPGVEGPAGSPLVGVSALRYPSGLAGPPDSSAYSGGQMSTSLASGIVAAEVQAQLDQSSQPSSSSLPAAAPVAPYRQQLASRQPPAATVAASARLPPESLTLAPNVGHSTTHSTTRTSRARSRSLHSSASYRSLSPPILSPAYDVDQSLSVPVDRGRPRLQRQPSLQPYRSPPSYNVSSVPVRMYLEPEPEVAQPRLVDVWTDVDPACLPRTATDVNVCQPGSAIDPRQFESATSVSASSAVVAHPTRLDVAYARAYGMTSSGIRPTLVGVPCQPGLALPSVINVARPYASSPCTVDVVRPMSTVIDTARPPGPSSVNEPRPVGNDDRRPMPPMGVRQPKSSVPIDVVESLPGPAPPTRVDVVGRQGLGAPTPVDVVRYPGPPFASVDIVGQQGLGAPTPVDVVRYPDPLLASVDVVHQPYSSTGADNVRPTPPQVLRWPGVADVPQPGLQPAVGVDGASGIVGPSLADVVYQHGAATSDAVTDHPSTWIATQYVAARANAAEFASVGTMTAKSLRRLDRLTASSDSSPHSRVIEWLQTPESMPPPSSVVEPVPVSKQQPSLPLGA